MEPGRDTRLSSPDFGLRLQRTQEVQQVLLLRGGQRIIVRNNAVRFRAVACVRLNRGNEV